MTGISTTSRLLASGFCIALAVVACTGEVLNSGGESVEEPSGDAASAVPTETHACTTPQESFEQELYVPVFSRCVGCHNELGVAPSQDAQLVLRMPGDHGCAEANTEVLSKLPWRSEHAATSPMPIDARSEMLVARFNPDVDFI